MSLPAPLTENVPLLYVAVPLIAGLPMLLTVHSAGSDCALAWVTRVAATTMNASAPRTALA